MRTRNKTALGVAGITGLAALIAVDIVAGPASRPPAMPDQTGNAPAQAYQAAEEAGYHLIDIRVGHPASKSRSHNPVDVEGLGGLKDGDVLADYAAWTVCVTESNHVDVSEPHFWSVDFYLVKNPSHCKKGKIPFARQQEYDQHADQARTAMDAVVEEAEAARRAPMIPTPTPDYTYDPDPDPARGSGSGTGGPGTSGDYGSNPDYYDGNYDNDNEWHERHGNPDEYYDGNYDNDDDYHDRYGRNSRY